MAATSTTCGQQVQPVEMSTMYVFRSMRVIIYSHSKMSSTFFNKSKKLFSPLCASVRRFYCCPDSLDLRENLRRRTQQRQPNAMTAKGFFFLAIHALHCVKVGQVIHARTIARPTTSSKLLHGGLLYVVADDAQLTYG